MLDIVSIRQLLDPLFRGLMGVTAIEAAADRVPATWVVQPALCTAGGSQHGAARLAIADTWGAEGTVLNLPAGNATTTTDSSTKFSASARVGSVAAAECLALQRGR